MRAPRNATRLHPSVQATGATHPGEPAPPPPQLLGLLGEYDTPLGMRVVLEDSGATVLRRHDSASRGAATDVERRVRHLARRVAIAARPERERRALRARRVRPRDVGDCSATLRLARREIEPRPGTNQLQVTPVRPVAEVRTEALAASPPRGTGQLSDRPISSSSCELDPTIKLEIRYATTNNFLGTRFYDEARAFMQRPAAEAVVRANASLKSLGYGLLIHDAYRPWYVTKMFWDATPHGQALARRQSEPGLEAQSRRRSRSHTVRSRYGTSRRNAEHVRREHRSRIRRLSGRNGGAAVAPRRAAPSDGGAGVRRESTEWWHFDYKDWRQYAIGNVTFDRIDALSSRRRLVGGAELPLHRECTFATRWAVQSVWANR